MLDVISKALDSIQKELIAKLEVAESKIATSPNGELRLKRSRGKNHYARKVKIDGKTQYIYISDNDVALIRALAEKAFYEQVRFLCKKNLEILKKNRPYFTFDIDAIALGKLDEGSRIVISEMHEDQNEAVRLWQSEKYIHNPYKPEYLIYETLRGEKVRSKGERDIVDALYLDDIPYKLEHPVEIRGEIIYCDIVILRRSDMKEIYWEHSGMLDRDRYIGVNYDRIAKYASVGIIIGQNLIITGETKDRPLSSRTLRTIIDAYCR